MQHTKAPRVMHARLFSDYGHLQIRDVNATKGYHYGILVARVVGTTCVTMDNLPYHVSLDFNSVSTSPPVHWLQSHGCYSR